MQTMCELNVDGRSIWWDTGFGRALDADPEPGIARGWFISIYPATRIADGFETKEAAHEAAPDLVRQYVRAQASQRQGS